MAEIPFDDEWNHDEWNGPPDGWYQFGTHAGWQNIPMLEFSEEKDESGMPLWERPPVQDDSSIRAALQDALHESEIRRKALFDALLKIEALKAEIEELRGEPETITLGISRCSACGHAPHGQACYNLASDNDCSCRHVSVQPA